MVPVAVASKKQAAEEAAGLMILPSP
ncbi:hypothetical protein HaLaN_14446 [Haematococcus lacustris]|uniref:Uncharacterized protein n=1 Tax=Haematococcus lacustris TaxID=44745 RepID=A0A699Z6L7_HAELA|nr:hypothetical protein HaLaN_14446 [Haematococcus lacustris]